MYVWESSHAQLGMVAFKKLKEENERLQEEDIDGRDENVLYRSN